MELVFQMCAGYDLRCTNARASTHPPIHTETPTYAAMALGSRGWGRRHCGAMVTVVTEVSGDLSIYQRHTLCAVLYVTAMINISEKIVKLYQNRPLLFREFPSLFSFLQL